MKTTRHQPRADEPTASGFAPTEFAAPGAEPQAMHPEDAAAPADAPQAVDLCLDATPDGVLPDGSAPDVLTDLGLDASNDSSATAAKPTLHHIGRYALKARIAVGGLGTVYEAWDPLLSRSVAVKMLHFDVATPARVSLDGLFLNEARTAAGLDHRGIVTVYDAGLSAHGVYIAMERLVGRDLRDALAQGWRPTPLRTALLGRRIADALTYAHGQGVVHCDIKPANIFITDKLRPKVLDFGIARAAGAAIPALDGLVAGSPHYLAPEQLQGGEVNERTDVYALGVVLHELLCGHKVFEGRSLDAIVEAVLHGQAPAPHDVDPAVPPALSQIVAKAMSRDPAARFESAAALSQALRDWLNEQQLQAASALVPKLLPLASNDSPERSVAQPRRPLVALTGLTAVVLLTGAAVMVAHTRSQDRQDAHGRTTAGEMAATAESNAASPTLASVATAQASSSTSTSDSAEPGRGVTGTEGAARVITPVARAAREPRVNPAPAGPVAVAVPVPAAPPQGALRLAITPWGQVEVDGAAAGTTPPLTMLMLPVGEHQVVVRNGDAAPFLATVQVEADRPAVLRHRFGP